MVATATCLKMVDHSKGDSRFSYVFFFLTRMIFFGVPPWLQKYVADGYPLVFQHIDFLSQHDLPFNQGGFVESLGQVRLGIPKNSIQCCLKRKGATISGWWFQHI